MPGERKLAGRRQAAAAALALLRSSQSTVRSIGPIEDGPATSMAIYV